MSNWQSKLECGKRSIAALVCCLHAAAAFMAPIAAHGESGSLQSAVSLLEAERFDEALLALDRAQDGGPDPRIYYYRAFALEKLGRCDEARSSYDSAATAGAGTALGQFAVDALKEFDTRCIAAPASTPQVDLESESPRPQGSRWGWKLLGWSTITLGTATLFAATIKNGVERSKATEAEEYFALRYGCNLQFGELGKSEACQREEMQADDAYTLYVDKVADARRTTHLLVGVGVGLSSVGLITLVSLAATRRAEVALFMLPGGGQATMTWRF